MRLNKVSRRPVLTGTVPFLNLLSRCPERLRPDASLFRFVEYRDLFSIFVNVIFIIIIIIIIIIIYIGLFRSVYIGSFLDLLRSVQMLKREWGVESNRKLPHLFIPSKIATLVPEFTVEDLPLAELQPWFLNLQ